MRVAIAVDETNVAKHFGRCEGYEIADIAGGVVSERHRVANPGHEPGVIPAMLNELGAKIVIAGGMGPRAEQLLKQHGIVGITGITGSVESALNALAAGELDVDGTNTCHH